MSTDTVRRWRAPPQQLPALLRVVRATGFWLAVALPLAYLPALLLATPVFADPAVLVSAVVGNVLALVVGHGHEPNLGPFVRRG